MSNSTANKRKSAAILFCDIKDYIGLLQEDMPKAIFILRLFQATLKEQVNAQQGRIVNFYGDAALAVFATPGEAMKCALSTQLFFKSHKVAVRIGVHCGPVIFDGDQVSGDTVNLSSKIESMGIAGSVLFSDSVNQEIRDHSAFEPVSLGHFEFEHVPEPIEVLALENEGLAHPATHELRAKFVEDRWIAIEPVHQLLPFLIGVNQLFSGQYDLARQQFKTLYLKNRKNRYYCLMAAFYIAEAGDHQLALEILKHSETLDQPNPLSGMGQMLRHGLEGNKEAGLACFTEEVKVFHSIDTQFSQILGAVLSFLGAKEEAIQWIRLAVDQGGLNYPYLSKYSRLLRNVQKEPAYLQLMEQIKKGWEQFLS